jgi:hypothetical protein
MGHDRQCLIEQKISAFAESRHANGQSHATRAAVGIKVKAAAGRVV